MDEVDKIIIHTLRQIGCNFDDDVNSLSKLTPEDLVQSIAKCLLLIRPDLTVPIKLPPGIAHRYNVTTDLAEACKTVGFRGDIGYQTFLYTNIPEIRRVFMFLIERMPKETDKSGSFDIEHIDKRIILENSIARNIQIQLNAPWIPQYCKKFGVRIFGNIESINASNNGFLPINLIVPYATQQNITTELQEYWLKRSPIIFHQTHSSNICSSIIHKNDYDCHKCAKNLKNKFQKFLQFTRKSTIMHGHLQRNHIHNIKTIQQLTLNNVEIPNENDIVVMPEISETDTIRFDVEKLKAKIEKLMQNRQDIYANTIAFKDDIQNEMDALVQLKCERKIKERTSLLLENPIENLSKMEKVLNTTQERINKLHDQWNEHRTPLIKQLEQARQSTSKKYSYTKQIMDQIKLTREKADEIAEDLKNKIAHHAQLVGEFEKNSHNISRNTYTSRILEIIGNIKKQKNEIDKIIRDTRELQKEINTINGQIDRQFAVTDDLLFKNAKKDETSKKAYKLLATLHSDCIELIQMVEDTGNVQREIRDLEDQIETENDRNISINLKQISDDLEMLEAEANELQAIIKKITDKQQIKQT